MNKKLLSIVVVTFFGIQAMELMDEGKRVRTLSNMNQEEIADFEKEFADSDDEQKPQPIVPKQDRTAKYKRFRENLEYIAADMEQALKSNDEFEVASVQHHARCLAKDIFAVGKQLSDAHDMKQAEMCLRLLGSTEKLVQDPANLPIKRRCLFPKTSVNLAPSILQVVREGMDPVN